MGPTDSDAVPDNGLDPELQRALREVGPEGYAASDRSLLPPTGRKQIACNRPTRTADNSNAGSVAAVDTQLEAPGEMSAHWSKCSNRNSVPSRSHRNSG